MYKNIFIISLFLTLFSIGNLAHGYDVALFKGKNTFPLGAEKFKITYYYLAEDRDPYPSAKRTVKILDRKGDVLANVTPEFYKNIVMEGSGRTYDLKGRRIVLSPWGKVDGVRRFFRSRYRFGKTSSGYGVRPFTSLAVDPRVVPLGSIVTIPSMIGVRLPNGKMHDGLFQALDTGGRIKGHHFDLHIKFKKYSRYFYRNTPLKSGHKVFAFWYRNASFKKNKK